MLVGEFLRCAQVVALVPGQGVEGVGLWFMVPQGVVVDVVVAVVGRLVQQADGLVADGLGDGYEAAGFEQVVHGAASAAFVLGRAAFPGEVVAVPAVQGEAAAEFSLSACLFVAVPLGAGFGATFVVGAGVFV